MSSNDRISNSQLNNLIPPEIKNDEFYDAIQRIGREENIKTVLEIGSSSGGGSTEAFVRGLRENPNQPTLFCMEISKPRFLELEKRYSNENFVKCYNVSSVARHSFATADEVSRFYPPSRRKQVLSWLQQDLEYLENFEVNEHGIRRIKLENNIELFDIVLIDGSEFTGTSELEEVYGAQYIILDDINTFKNYQNHQNLLIDKSYELITQNYHVRNGYSIFRKMDEAESFEFREEVKEQSLGENLVRTGMAAFENHIACPSLPIHFSTIVLNGEPFIRYHIDVFKKLSCNWHWHIVEGVADLKHDTAWSIQLGGEITGNIHRNGLSRDGTSEYLDELAQLYPENITLYRKPEGAFWDGKLEMVNAPLSSIQEECLLWQVDVDELWTVEQIDSARKMFIEHPEKTAAFYWCWYFVGERLLISTRNCYAQNPQQEWLRTWRFKPGARWAAHEPPVLVEPSTNGQWSNVAAVNPFTHAETEQQGLVFQHFAYTTAEQLQFKEQYYGYKDAVSKWQSLQEQNRFPILLRQHFSWVQDNTMVDTAESMGVMPIAQRNSDHDAWCFLDPEALQQAVAPSKPTPVIIVDGVFFQLYKTGIARVWQTLLEEWVETGFAQHIVFLDRARSAPVISGINYRLIPPYDYNAAESDREMLQQICEEENADLFISTYYTTPLETPSVFMAYDMIPEVMNWNLNHAMWRQKHHGIQHASAYITISDNTARDLVTFFPDVDASSVTVAHCGVKDTFSPAPNDEIQHFKIKYGIFKPYFILAGAGSGYKNSILFFKAFSRLYSRSGFDVVCTGSNSLGETEFRDYTAGSTVHMLQLDDNELRAAYSGAIALIYPSKYEGFGLPIVEAMACGCPVITCPNASIPEVAGEAALYIRDNDVEELANALCDVQKPQIRQALTAKGLEQARSFSWKKMAEKVSSALIEVTLLPLKLNEINLIVFPDWGQPEESLQLELSNVIRAIAAHPEKDKITLLIDNRNIAEEDANLFLSGVAMGLFLEEDLDVSEGPDIAWCGQISSTTQWSILLPRINFRVALNHESHITIAALDLQNIPSLEPENIEKLNL